MGVVIIVLVMKQEEMVEQEVDFLQQYLDQMVYLVDHIDIMRVVEVVV